MSQDERIHQVYQLLRLLFGDKSDLDLFLETIYGDTLTGALPGGNASWKMTAKRAADLLVRSGYSDLEFFEQLVEKFPRREADIRRVQTRVVVRDDPQASRGGLQRKQYLGKGRFLLLKIIGSGGFSTVWKALDEETDDVVAVKVLHPRHAADEKRRSRFFRGARTMAKLGHERIVKVVEARGEEAGICFTVYEYIDGRDLHQSVRGGHITRERALRAIFEAGEALEYAHVSDCVHRDIKPANILLDRHGRAFLSDFDLVLAPDSTRATKSDESLGTLLYVAPETIDAAREATIRSDVYSLAMTAVFVLLEKTPSIGFLRSPDTEIAKLECSEAIREVLRRGIAWEPTERYSSIREFCDALREASQHEESTPPPVSLHVPVVPARPVIEADTRPAVERQAPDPAIEVPPTPALHSPPEPASQRTASPEVIATPAPARIQAPPAPEVDVPFAPEVKAPFAPEVDSAPPPAQRFLSSPERQPSTDLHGPPATEWERSPSPEPRIPPVVELDRPAFPGRSQKVLPMLFAVLIVGGLALYGLGWFDPPAHNPLAHHPEDLPPDQAVRVAANNRLGTPEDAHDSLPATGLPSEAAAAASNPNAPTSEQTSDTSASDTSASDTIPDTKGVSAELDPQPSASSGSKPPAPAKKDSNKRRKRTKSTKKPSTSRPVATESKPAATSTNDPEREPDYPPKEPARAPAPAFQPPPPRSAAEIERERASELRALQKRFTSECAKAAEAGAEYKNVLIEIDEAGNGRLAEYHRDYEGERALNCLRSLVQKQKFTAGQNAGSTQKKLSFSTDGA